MGMPKPEAAERPSRLENLVTLSGNMHPKRRQRNIRKYAIPDWNPEL